MIEENLLKEFLKHFRISLTNAGVYFEYHPLLLKSVDETKYILDDILFVITPFFIGITPDSLLIEGKYLKGNKIYTDLASHFHHRRIKSIAFSKGVTSEDLRSFLSIVSAPLKNIVKNGDIGQWTSKENIHHISTEELDYSELLGESESSEDKDIWKFLIEKAYKKKEFSSDLEKLSDDFEKIIYKFSTGDLKEDPSFMTKIIETLHYMKESDPERFKNCSKTMVKFILDRNESLANNDIAKEVQDFFRGIDNDMLSDIIWEYNFESKKFDPFVMEVFSKLVDNDAQQSIAASIDNKFASNSASFNDAETKGRLEELLSSSGKNIIPLVYRDTLSSLLNNIQTNGSFNFEREYIYENYIYSLLNLLSLEDKELRVEIIASSIIKEWPRVTGLSNITIVKNFLNVLDEKIKESDDTVIYIYNNIKNSIISSLENVILNNIDTLSYEDMLFLSGFISSSKFDPHSYIEKIMEGGHSKDGLVRLFLNLFPNDTNLLCDSLRDNISRFKSANSVVNMLRRINTKQSLDVLKSIFAIANPMLRADILRAMQSMSIVDDEFVFKALVSKNILLRKEALAIIVTRSVHLNKRAVKVLVDIFNPFGVRNAILIENIKIIADKNIKEAIDVLISIKRKHYIWHGRELKKVIQETLDKLNING